MNHLKMSLNNKKGIWNILLEWSIIIFGLIAILGFLFYTSLPGVITIMQKMGLIEETKIPKSSDLNVVTPKTEQEKEAVAALESIKKSFLECKQMTKEKCTCNIERPTFSPDYTINFENGNGKIIAYIFNSSEPSNSIGREVPGQTLSIFEVSGLQLCTSRDLRNKKEADQEEYVSEDMFQLKWSGLSNSPFKRSFEIRYPKDYKGFNVLGTKEQFDAGDKEFKLYRADSSHVCFIIARDGDDTGSWLSGLYSWQITDYREKIGAISSCEVG
ncbi:MAG: hypothetical protein NT001_00115 [Candidatus Woesearchaeota archaeon]|nr:hypothetical protein [Candidatus Woesearchaeota archaeon]